MSQSNPDFIFECFSSIPVSFSTFCSFKILTVQYRFKLFLDTFHACHIFIFCASYLRAITKPSRSLNLFESHNTPISFTIYLSYLISVFEEVDKQIVKLATMKIIVASAVVGAAAFQRLSDEHATLRAELQTEEVTANLLRSHSGVTTDLGDSTCNRCCTHSPKRKELCCRTFFLWNMRFSKQCTFCIKFDVIFESHNIFSWQLMN